MPQAVLANLDDIEENLRTLYTEKDGSFVLNVEGIDNHPAVKNLKSAHETVKAENRKVKADLKIATDKLSQIPGDFDVDEYSRLVTEDEARKSDPTQKDMRAQLDAQAANIKAQWETKLALAVRKVEAELKAERENNSALKGTLNKRLVDDYLTKALVEAGITTPGLLKAAKAMHSSAVEVVDDDGEHKAQMVNGFDIATWAQTDEGKIFVTPATGGNAQGNNRTTRAGERNPFTKEFWNMTDQGQILKSDRSRYERLAKAAGFHSVEAANRATGPINK